MEFGAIPKKLNDVDALSRTIIADIAPHTRPKISPIIKYDNIL